MANIWTILRERDSRNIPTKTLRATRISLLRRLAAVQREGGSWEQTGTGVVLSINGKETTDLERAVRIDARVPTSAVDKRKV